MGMRSTLFFRKEMNQTRLLINCCNAIYVPMRVLFMLLIFAIGFSGYTAAAHAYGSDCSGMSQTQDSATKMVVCPDSQDNAGDQTDKSQVPNSMDCHHCCCSQLGFQSDFSMNIETGNSVLSPTPYQVPADSHISSLLRPPKSFV